MWTILNEYLEICVTLCKLLKYVLTLIFVLIYFSLRLFRLYCVFFFNESEISMNAWNKLVTCNIKLVFNMFTESFARWQVIDSFGTSIYCWTQQGAWNWLEFCSESAAIVDMWSFASDGNLGLVVAERHFYKLPDSYFGK
jgi:hypothetical protein